MIHWLITVASVAILTVIVDVIMPEGQTKKTVGVVVGIVISFVLISGITDLSISDGKKLFNNIDIDQNLIDNLEKQQVEQIELSIEGYLSRYGIEVKQLTVSHTEKSIKLSIANAKSTHLESIVDSCLSIYARQYTVNIIWQEG